MHGGGQAAGVSACCAFLAACWQAGQTGMTLVNDAELMSFQSVSFDLEQ